jgi:pyruvate formate lyase activating enzyme
MGKGERGFCGLRIVKDGKLLHLAGMPERGLLHWYRDPLSTNCVADWVCEGSQHSGYHNLVAFYASCTAGKELAGATDTRTFCVCYFWGDPSSQMAHALAASKLLAAQGVRICWESNGMMHPKLMRNALRYAF